MKRIWCAFKDTLFIILIVLIGLFILLLALFSGFINWIWMKCTKKDETLIPFGNWIEKFFGLDKDTYEEDNYNSNDNNYL